MVESRSSGDLQFMFIDSGFCRADVCCVPALCGRAVALSIESARGVLLYQWATGQLSLDYRLIQDRQLTDMPLVIDRKATNDFTVDTSVDIGGRSTYISVG